MCVDQGVKSYGSLGHLYLHGLGVPQDTAQAKSYFEAGAAIGDAASQNGLGYMYLHGIGVPQSTDKGFELVKKAADQGHPEALYNLALLKIKVCCLLRLVFLKGFVASAMS